MTAAQQFSKIARAATLGLGLAWVGPVIAANTQSAPEPRVLPETREEATDMVATLSDEDVRKLLLEHLDRTLPQGAQEAKVAGPWVITRSHVALDKLTGLFSRRDTLGAELARMAGVVAEGHAHPWLALLGAILACLGAGTLLERFMLRPRGLLGGMDQIARTASEGRLSAGQALLAGACRAVGALVFLIGAVLCLHLVPGLSDGARTLASAAVWLVAGTRLVSSGIHAALLPAGGESPWPIRTPVARAVARYLSVVTAFVLVLTLDDHVLQALEANPDVKLAVSMFNSALLMAAILVALFAVRRAMGPVTDGGRRSGVRWLLKDRWHLVASAYVLVVIVLAWYGALVTGHSVLVRALASLSLVLVVPVADYGLRLLAARLAPAPPAPDRPVLPPEEDEFPQFEDVHEGPNTEIERDARIEPAAVSAPETIPVAREAAAEVPVVPQAPSVDGQPSYIEAALMVNFRLLLALALLKAIGELWELRIFELIGAMFGAKLAGALSEIAVAALFAFIVWQIIKAALAVHAVPQTEGFDLGGDGGAAGQSRVQTLMPLIAKTVGAVLVVMLALISLSAFGVNIGPLLAGAGVLGLAVGFGAQTLVRDIVSGVFYLVDDAFRMGEYLQIGNIRGTVEKISVRSLRLRHHRGPLHTLPYGEIHSMTNYSRDYAIMKFEVRVAFETDVEKVRKLIKQVGVELAQNEELAAVMLEPLKSQGVNRMDDSAFVIRCKFTTIPGKQFTVRRIAYAMIQEAFAREGIQFAPKRVVVETVAPPGSKEALAAAGAAAAEVQEEPLRRASGDDR